jgi:putative acetyltransferase
VIRIVMPEFGAKGPGFAIADPEVDFMFDAYSKPRHAYFVARSGGRVVGGAGIGPLAGTDGSVCELRKMYLLEEARGQGVGQKLLDLCLGAAKARKFRSCYLETLGVMGAARRLYQKNGFVQLPAPMGKTGHFGCDRWFARPL